MQVITFDTETTGLLQDPEARIIEIGAVRHNLITGQQTASFSRLCRPRYLDDGKFEIAERICNISKEQILEAPPYAEVIEDFCRWAGDYLIYAWNLPFDQRMLQRTIWDIQDTEGPFLQTKSREWLDNLHYAGCWQHLYAYMHPERAGCWDNGQIKTISLQRAIYYEGLNADQEHRALSDAHFASQIGNIIHQKLL
jgi:DNA polymerase III epsilon subunit-like protein